MAVVGQVHWAQTFPRKTATQSASATHAVEKSFPVTVVPPQDRSVAKRRLNKIRFMHRLLAVALP